MNRPFFAVCLALLTILGGLITTAPAHEGHGWTSPGQGDTVWHYATDPVHIAQWVALAVVAIITAVGLVRFKARLAQKNPRQA